VTVLVQIEVYLIGWNTICLNVGEVWDFGHSQPEMVEVEGLASNKWEMCVLVLGSE